MDLKDKIRTDALLFGESQSRIILSCSKDSVSKIETIANKHNAPITIIGTIGGNSLKINIGGKNIIKLDCARLKKQRQMLKDILERA